MHYFENIFYSTPNMGNSVPLVYLQKYVSNFHGVIPAREAPSGAPGAPTGLGLLGQLYAAVLMGRTLFRESPSLSL